MNRAASDMIQLSQPLRKGIKGEVCLRVLNQGYETLKLGQFNSNVHEYYTNQQYYVRMGTKKSSGRYQGFCSKVPIPSFRQETDSRFWPFVTYG